MNIGNASAIHNETVRTNALRHLTVAQAAKELGLAESTIRAWIGQRRIGHVRLGRSVRIPAAEVERLLEQSFTPARRS